MSGLLPVAEARRRILGALPAMPSETVPLRPALGRVLAAPLYAGRDQPPGDVSSMDGYALRASDIRNLPVTLRVTAEIAAGQAPDRPVGLGEAQRIFTGALIPPGADCVVIQENTEAPPEGPGFIRIRTGAAAGANIRRRGGDFAAGSLGIAAGRRLNPRDLALAAALNHAEVAVSRRPRIAILATGSELVPPGTEPGPAEIIASSGFGLAAAIESWGGTAIDLGLAPDDPRAIAGAIARAAEADLLVTLGGASVGAHDLVKDVLTESGFTLDFWKIAMKPGKPLIFGTRGPLPVLGLPGNPVSTLICALVFLRAGIFRMLGRQGPDGGAEDALPEMMAVLGRDLPANHDRLDYLRGTLGPPAPGGLPIALPADTQDSSQTFRLAAATCLIPRTPFAPVAKAGELHTIVPLEGLF